MSTPFDDFYVSRSIPRGQFIVGTVPRYHDHELERDENIRAFIISAIREKMERESGGAK